MDMSKAFDMVEWSELFQTLLKRNVDPLFLRLILFIYQHQYHTDLQSVTVSGKVVSALESSLLFTSMNFL